jgi:hypothetical protein
VSIACSAMVNYATDDEQLWTGPVYRSVGIQQCAISVEYTDAPELGFADHGVRI